MKTLTVKAKEVICRKGDSSNSMFLIKSGKVGIFSGYGCADEAQIAVLGAGKYFGEMGIVEKQPRSADVVALAKSELVEISADDFSSFVANNPSDIVSIMKNMSKRLRDTTGMFKKASKTVSMYVDSGENTETKYKSKLEEIAEYHKALFAGFKRNATAAKTEYAAGEILFRQGEPGACMFQVLEGEAVFYLNYGKPSRQEIATACKGDIFGEMAVIEAEKRSATVVAKTALKVRTVANGQLEEFLTSHPEDAIRILKNISAKLRDTTEKYIGVLATIAQFVAEEKEILRNMTSADQFVEFADRYNAYASAGNYIPFLFY